MHIIHLINSGFFYLVHMKEEEGDRVHGYLFTTVGDVDKGNDQQEC
jgi:hypothetical protein